MKRIGLLAVSVASLFTVGSAFGLSLTLKNKTGKDIHELYFAPAGEEEWGPDQLGEDVIANGAKFTLQGIPKAKYDVMIVDADSKKCDIRDVDFTSSEEVELKDLGDCHAASEQDE